MTLSSLPWFHPLAYRLGLTREPLKGVGFGPDQEHRDMWEDIPSHRPTIYNFPRAAALLLVTYVVDNKPQVRILGV
jgi:hypothetical protein